MRDTISIQRVALLHPKVRGDFSNFITDAENGLNIVLRVLEGLRTFEVQAEYYSHGRTKLHDAAGNRLGVITNSRPGQSYHQYGLAVDLGQLIDNNINWKFDYKQLVPYADKYQIVWGGSFHSIIDKPHFEKHFGIHWSDLLIKYNSKIFIPDTQYVVI